jgi:hypothetical protein
MEALSARLKIDGRELTQSLSRTNVAVTFETELTAGPKKFSTRLTDAATGKDRGAYFVEVTLLDSNSK